MPLEERKKLIDVNNSQLSISMQSGLLQMHRSVNYYKPKGISSADLHLMELLDRIIWNILPAVRLAIAGIWLSRGIELAGGDCGS